MPSGAEFEAPVDEPGIAQTEAERIERGGLQVHVGAAPAALDPVTLRLLHVVIHRQLAGVAGNGHGEPAAGVHVPEQHLGAPLVLLSRPAATPPRARARVGRASGSPAAFRSPAPRSWGCPWLERPRPIPAGGRSVRAWRSRSPRRRSRLVPGCATRFSPSTTTAASAAAAASRAREISFRSAPSTLQPLTKTTWVSGDTARLMPSSTFTTGWGMAFGT